MWRDLGVVLFSIVLSHGGIRVLCRLGCFELACSISQKPVEGVEVVSSGDKCTDPLFCRERTEIFISYVWEV